MSSCDYSRVYTVAVFGLANTWYVQAPVVSFVRRVIVPSKHGVTIVNKRGTSTVDGRAVHSYRLI